ncbi:MAG TPA: DcaP family trimeric outer membrane transporter [Anaeromyxobacter sp.]|nr:DcaP family trimeric outer membrane transporter [Anaeromyxobacter sp.]
MNRTKQLLTALATTAALVLPGAALPQEPPGYFKIPGTDTTLKLYGFVQVYGTDDLSGRIADIENYDWATIVPVQPLNGTPDAKEKGRLYFTARTSRLGVTTTTPTRFGALDTKLEGDFNGPNGFQGQTYTNSVLFRLRHAYATMAGFLVGQTWSLFLDFPSAPDTVDFNGPGTLALVRQPQVRYTFQPAPDMSVAVGVENPHNGGVGHLPDFTAKFGYTPKWASLGLGFVTNQYRYSKLGDGTPNNRTAQGYGVSLSGSTKLPWNDTVLGLLVFGNGVGRYMFNAIANFDGPDSSGNLKLWQSTAYHLGYTHVWNGEFRSNVIWSQTFFSRNGIDPSTFAPADDAGSGTFVPNKRIDQLFLNTFWDIAKNTELGVEYELGRRHTQLHQTGKEDRITVSATYNFF